VALSQALSLPLQALFGLYSLHALSRTLQTLSCEILPAFLQNIYFYCSYSSKTFIKGHESAFRGRENAFRGRETVCKESRMPLEAVTILEIESTLKGYNRDLRAKESTCEGRECF
jgi:hypothetical protein